MRHNYNEHGVDGYYDTFGGTYINPHDEALRLCLFSALDKWYRVHDISLTRTLDLACGSGEATLALLSWCASKRDVPVPRVLVGADPYTHQAYERRVGKPAERFSFRDIQDGHLEDRKFTLVISSFALHLLTDKSKLWATITQLSFSTKHLIILTPHKRPEIPDFTMGFVKTEELRAERIRVRLYESINFNANDSADEKRDELES